MNQPLVSAFRFRGQRTYLHSTTIFDFLVGQDPRPENVDFSFHRMTNRQCTILVDEDKSRDEPLIATYRSQGARWHLYERNEEIEGNYPCNESEICANSAFADTTAQFQMPPIADASYLECVVGVYKNLLQRRFPDLSGMLVFARVSLQRIPSEGLCGVEHRRRMGDEFFHGQLTSADQPVGKLIFALQ